MIIKIISSTLWGVITYMLCDCIPLHWPTQKKPNLKTCIISSGARRKSNHNVFKIASHYLKNVVDYTIIYQIDVWFSECRDTITPTPSPFLSTKSSVISEMKMPERSRTSRVPPMDIPFAQKSFCYDGLRHTHKYITNRQDQLYYLHCSSGRMIGIITNKHTHRNMDVCERKSTTINNNK